MPFSQNLQSFQTAYNLNVDNAIAGMLSGSWSYTYGKLISRTLRSPATKQVLSALTITKGANAGNYTLTLAGTNPVTGSTFNIATVYAALSGDSATVVAAALAAAINSNTTLNDFLYASAASAVLTITLNSPYINPVTTYTIAATGSGNSSTSATITNATTSSVGNYGYLAGNYSGDEDKLCQPVSTASGLNQLGVFAIATTKEQPYNPTSLSALSYSLGDSCTIAPVGSRLEIWVPVAAAVVAFTVPDIIATTGQFTTAGADTAVTGTLYLTSQATPGGLAKVRL